MVLMMGLCRMTLSLEMAAFTQDPDPSISRTLLQTGGLYIGGRGGGSKQELLILDLTEGGGDGNFV